MPATEEGLALAPGGAERGRAPATRGAKRGGGRRSSRTALRSRWRAGARTSARQGTRCPAANLNRKVATARNGEGGRRPSGRGRRQRRGLLGRGRPGGGRRRAAMRRKGGGAWKRRGTGATSAASGGEEERGARPEFVRRGRERGREERRSGSRAGREELGMSGSGRARER
jgi:hypothetical protein